jgi:kynurenine formamidase
MGNNRKRGDLTGYRLVSMAQPIDGTMPVWPGDPTPAFEPVAAIEREGFFLRGLSLGEHSATHQNAPISFFDGAADIASIAPVLLPLIVADWSTHCADRPHRRFDDKDLAEFESKFGQVFAGGFFVLNTGWHRLWNDPLRFLGGDDRSSPAFPSFDESAIDALLARGVAGVGIDTHGIDAPDDLDYACQKKLLAAGKRVIECLGNLDGLPAMGASIVIAPLPLVGGSGSPIAPLALVPAAAT